MLTAALEQYTLLQIQYLLAFKGKIIEVIEKLRGAIIC